MDMRIRPYEPDDRNELERLVATLQEHVASLDPQGIYRPKATFDVARYADFFLAKVREREGTVLVAEKNGVILGYVAGTVVPETPEYLLDHQPGKEGYVNELIVDTAHRGKRGGSRLMSAMEGALRAKGCAFVRVGCFVPNRSAHDFYRRCGYTDRHIELLKRL